MFADIITEGRPALFAAWPSASRTGDFDRAIESYRLAAADVEGIFLPVAAAWQAAMRRDPSIQLYADGLHPSPEGAYLAALVVYGGLLQRSPLDLPNVVRVSRSYTLSIPSDKAAILREVAAEALEMQ